MIGLIVSFFSWHYSKAIADLFEVAGNYIWFVWRFFSISTLSRTLFAPWERMGEDHRKGEGVKGFFETFVINTIMRLVGLLIRLLIILSGFIALALILVLTALALCIWIVLPFAGILLFVSGIRLLLM